MDVRGKNKVSSFSRGASVWKSCLLDMLADMRLRSNSCNLVHFERAAKLFIAKDACGATNSSRLGLRRPKSRAVSEREELCTRRLISSRTTKGASGECRIRAFFEGQIVVMKGEKFEPVMEGRA